MRVARTSVSDVAIRLEIEILARIGACRENGLAALKGSYLGRGLVHEVTGFSVNWKNPLRQVGQGLGA
jgi:hypothetical protein